jgi:abortive infection bacteriophage resistance protein
MTSPFEKPATTVLEQLSLLQQRGLIINDPTLAEYYLTHVGYYRLAGYWRFLQNDPITHTFITGSTFSMVAELYNFDRELRLLLADAIERIEVSFAAIAG